VGAHPAGIGDGAAVVAAHRLDPRERAAEAEAARSNAISDARQMLRATTEASSALMEALGIQNEAWTKFQITRNVSAAVSQRWQQTASEPGGPRASVMDLVPVWAAIADQELAQMVFDRPADDDRTALTIAVLEAMRPVVDEVRKFDFFRDASACESRARDRILGAAHAVATSIAPQSASEHSKRQLLRTLIVNAGQLYATAWRRQGEAVIGELMALPPQTVRERFAANPEGFPLDEVEREFDESFARLTNLAGALARPQAAPEAGGDPRAR
jgi:hypothetical protein